MNPIPFKIWVLAREPFNIPPSVAVQMPMDQIDHILTPFENLPEPTAPEDNFNAYQFHLQWGRLNRLPRWYVDQLWREANA